MAWRHWLIIAVGALAIVAGVVLTVADELPRWVPDWDAELRLVLGIGIAFGGFVVGAFGGLAGMTGIQSMGGRLERGRGGRVSGAALAVAGLLGTAGGLVGWWPGLRAWVSALGRLHPDHRFWLAIGLFVAAGCTLLLFGYRRAPKPAPPPPNVLE